VRRTPGPVLDLQALGGCQGVLSHEQFWSVSGFSPQEVVDGLPKDIQVEMVAAGPETENTSRTPTSRWRNKAIGS